MQHQFKTAVGMRPVYFQHLRKTGGTSVVDMLKLFFCSDRIGFSGQLTEKQAIKQADKDLRDFDLCFGHGEILSLAPLESFKFAVFREPFARLLSERRQWMDAQAENIAASPADIAQAILTMRQQTLATILPQLADFPITLTTFWNHQAVILGAWPLLRETPRPQSHLSYEKNRFQYFFPEGRALRAWLLDNKGEILRRALKSLRTLDFVGLTETLDGDACEIFARLGLPEPGDVVRRNVRNPYPDEVDPALPELAAEFIELDNELYDAARERHALQGRIARGTPLDYIGRRLSQDETLVVSAREPPGGHGWYPPHRRGDSDWSRWTGPGLQSRFALSAPAGWYKMMVVIYGAASARSLLEARVSIEGRGLVCTTGNLPSGVHTLTVDFERRTCGRFDILFDFPDVGSEYGWEVKEITFEPLSEPPGFE